MFKYKNTHFLVASNDEVDKSQMTYNQHEALETRVEMVIFPTRHLGTKVFPYKAGHLAKALQVLSDEHAKQLTAEAVLYLAEDKTQEETNPDSVLEEEKDGEECKSFNETISLTEEQLKTLTTAAKSGAFSLGRGFDTAELISSMSDLYMVPSKRQKTSSIAEE